MTFFNIDERHNERICQLLQGYRDNQGKKYRKWVLIEILRLVDITRLPSITAIHASIAHMLLCTNHTIEQAAANLRFQPVFVIKKKQEIVEALFQHFLGESVERRKQQVEILAFPDRRRNAVQEGSSTIEEEERSKREEDVQHGNDSMEEKREETIKKSPKTGRKSQKRKRDTHSIFLEESYTYRRYVVSDASERSSAMTEYLADRSSKKLKDRAVLANMGLVYKVAHKIFTAIKYKEKFESDDIVHMGIEGLIAALEKFDPRKKTKFSTYATHYIRGYILHYIFRDTDAFNAQRKKEDLDKIAKMRPLTAKEQALYEQIELYLEKVSCNEKWYRGFDDDSEVTIIEMLASKDLSTEDRAFQAIESAALQDAFEKLSEKSKHIIRRHVFEELSFSVIANEMGCTNNWPSHLFQRALQEFRGILGVANGNDKEDEDAFCHVETLNSDNHYGIRQLWRLHDQTSSHKRKRQLIQLLYSQTPKDALTVFSEIYRDILHLYVEGATDQKIGAIVGYSRDTVVGLKQKIIQKFRDSTLAIAQSSENTQHTTESR